MTTAETIAKDTREAPVVVELGADLSPVIRALERAYRMIAAQFADTPAVTIVVKRDSKAWGHTTIAKTWRASAGPTKDADRYEIMISGENLCRGAVETAGTLLHEAAHARNLAVSILDTDLNGRHNAKFRTRAEEHGLTVATMGWHGFAQTTLDEDTMTAWHRKLVATVAAGIAKSAVAANPARTVGPGKGTGPGADPNGEDGSTGLTPPKRGNRNLIKAVCGCGDSIRASRGVLDRARPVCQVCDEPFVDLDADPAEDLGVDTDN